MYLLCVHSRLSTLLSLLLPFLFFCPSAYSEIISHDPVTELSILVDKNDWYNFQKAAPESNSSTPCIINSQPYNISYHGSPRSRRDASRASYRVSSPEHTFILKAEAFDPSMLRELLGYFIFQQAGILAPVVSPTLLKVNNIPSGLYIAVTPVDSHTVKKLHPGNFNQTALYYGYIKNTKERRIRPDLKVAADRYLYPLAYEELVCPTAEGPFAPLDQLLTFLNTSTIRKEEANMILDVPGWINWFAVSEIIENRDSPWLSGSRNYSLFRPPTGGWQILPWDPDHIYEDKGIFFPTSNVNGVKKLTSMPWFKKTVRKRVGQLVRGGLQQDIILAELQRLSEKIGPAIESGAVKGLDFEQWSLEVDKLAVNIKNRYRHLLSLTHREQILTK